MATLWKLVGASYTMHFARQFKDGYVMEHLSLWELCEGNLEGGFLYWGP
jgi:hypothetical protein